MFRRFGGQEGADLPTSRGIFFRARRERSFGTMPGLAGGGGEVVGGAAAGRRRHGKGEPVEMRGETGSAVRGSVRRGGLVAPEARGIGSWEGPGAPGNETREAEVECDVRRL